MADERTTTNFTCITAVLVHHTNIASHRIVRLEHSLCTCADLGIATSREMDILPSRHTATGYDNDEDQRTKNAANPTRTQTGSSVGDRNSSLTSSNDFPYFHMYVL